MFYGAPLATCHSSLFILQVLLMWFFLITIFIYQLYTWKSQLDMVLGHFVLTVPLLRNVGPHHP